MTWLAARPRLRGASAQRELCAALVLALGGACSRPLALDWKQDLQAASASTPLVTEGFIAVGHEHGVSLLEPDGEPRCTFDAHGEVIGRPASNGTLVYFGSTNYHLYAIDLACQQVWQLAARDRIKCDTLYDAGLVFTASYDGHVYALEESSGAVRWMFPPPPPKLADVLAALAAEVDQEEVAPKTSKGKGQSDPPTSPGTTASASVPEVGDFSYSSPVIAGGVIYIGNLDGFVYALDARSGALRWRFATAGAVTSTPLVAKGSLYVGSHDGYLYALELPSAADAQPAVRWKHPTGDWINSSARLADGVIYVGSNDRHVYALDAASGQQRWQFATKGPAIAIPTLYEDLVFAAGGSGDGTIYALERVSGALFWQDKTGGKIESDPVIVGRRLYVTSADQFLYAYEIRATKR